MKNFEELQEGDIISSKTSGIIGWWKLYPTKKPYGKFYAVAIMGKKNIQTHPFRNFYLNKDNYVITSYVSKDKFPEIYL